MAQENIAYRLTSPIGPSGITKDTTPIPNPKAYEVLVRIHAVSLNFRDFAISKGLYPLPMKKEPIMGSDMAGEVVEIGDGVTQWKVGDRVTANFEQGHLYGPQLSWTGECFCLFYDVVHPLFLSGAFCRRCGAPTRSYFYAIFATQAPIFLHPTNRKFFARFQLF